MLSISLDDCLDTTIAERLYNNNSIIDETLRYGNVSNQITLSAEESGLGPNPCKITIFQLHVAFLILWSVALLIEVAIICVSLRGAILEAHLRWPAEYLLYVKLGKLVPFSYC